MEQVASITIRDNTGDIVGRVEIQLAMKRGLSPHPYTCKKAEAKQHQQHLVVMSSHFWLRFMEVKIEKVDGTRCTA